MSLKEIKDKLEIGLKRDAPYRPTNLPESQQPHPPHAPGVDPPTSDAPEESEKDRPASRRNSER